MRFAAAAFGLFLVLSDFSMGAVEEPKIVEKVTPLPIALNRDFEFRKTKLYFLSEKLPKQTQERRTASSVTGTLSGRTAPTCGSNAISSSELSLVLVGSGPV